MSLRNKTIREALQQGKLRLQEAGKADASFDAELLLEKAVGINRTALFLRGEEMIPNEAAELYEDFLTQRAAGRPTQYILGEWEFMGLPFAVGEGVLIPRGDTEVLVETILEKQQTEQFKSILDIGTGSGCIPISLGHYGKFETIMAVDISQKALGYATKNAEKNNVNIDFYESDLFTNLPVEWQGNLDAIVSNPPYIAKKVIEELETEVKDFEPLNALDGGEDGLDFYKAIVEQSREWLKAGGWLFFEIGYDQGEALLSLMTESGYEEVTLKQDLSGLDRVVYGKYNRKGAY